ncbi:MAG: hypothetical protein WCO63_14090, partial [Bacteroidota bacterium]
MAKALHQTGSRVNFIRESDWTALSALLSSEFNIRCFNSVKLSRCLEADFCRDCSGIYFSHNCENVHDSMFCFNVKNLRHAIGNVEVGREKFMAT